MNSSILLQSRPHRINWALTKLVFFRFLIWPNCCTILFFFHAKYTAFSFLLLRRFSKEVTNNERWSFHSSYIFVVQCMYIYIWSGYFDVSRHPFPSRKRKSVSICCILKSENFWTQFCDCKTTGRGWNQHLIAWI